jgi:hypothetical protein
MDYTTAFSELRRTSKHNTTLALLEIISLGNSQIEKGQLIPAKKAFAKVRRSRRNSVLARK